MIFIFWNFFLDFVSIFWLVGAYPCRKCARSHTYNGEIGRPINDARLFEAIFLPSNAKFFHIPTRQREIAMKTPTLGPFAWAKMRPKQLASPHRPTCIPFKVVVVSPCARLLGLNAFQLQGGFSVYFGDRPLVKRVRNAHESCNQRCITWGCDHIVRGICLTLKLEAGQMSNDE